MTTATAKALRKAFPASDPRAYLPHQFSPDGKVDLHEQFRLGVEEARAVRAALVLFTSAPGQDAPPGPPSPLALVPAMPVSARTGRSAVVNEKMPPDAEL